MFEVRYMKYGQARCCECVSYVQAFNFISCIRNRIARRLMAPTTIEMYNPDGHMSYQLLA